MAVALVLYKHPADPAAFDTHYTQTHLPMAKKVPGLRRLEVSDGPIASAGGGASDYYRAAKLHFDSMGDLKAGFGSPEGQATAGDAMAIATGGIEVLLFDTKDV